MLTTPRSRPHNWPMLKSAIFVEAPWGRIEQCSNGHLMCAEVEGGGPDLILNRDGGAERQEQSCASQVRAVRGPKCPVCRQGLTGNAIRGLSAEQSIAVLPARCRHCHGSVSRGSLRAHEVACPRAPLRCAAEGCRWTSRRDEKDTHEATCVWGKVEVPPRVRTTTCMHRYLMTHVSVYHLYFMYVMPLLKAGRSATTYFGVLVLLLSDCCYYKSFCC